MSGILQHLMAAGPGDAAKVNAASYGDFAIWPNNASAGIEFRNTGGMYKKEGDGAAYSYQYDWKTGPNAASAYDIRATVTGDAPTTGTTGSWLNLGTSRVWAYDVTAVGMKLGSLLIEIRSTSTGIVLASATINFDVQVEV